MRGTDQNTNYNVFEATNTPSMDTKGKSLNSVSDRPKETLSPTDGGAGNSLYTKVSRNLPVN